MTALWDLILGSDVVKLIGGAILAILGIWGYGKSKERAGVKKERAAQKAKDMEAEIETADKVSSVRKSDSVADARKRLSGNKR